MGIVEDIGRGPVALDTVVFIYWIEEHPEYVPILQPLFEAIDAGRFQGFTSALTLLEVLVRPYRVGDHALAERYERVLSSSRNLTVVDLGSKELRAAAHLRATFLRVRTPDAIQLAAAMQHGCSAFVTNDRELPATPGLPVLQLRRYAER